MPLVYAIDLVREAAARNAAALSFVCIDYNEARAVVNAAEQTGKPAIIMLLPEYVTKYSLNGFGEFAAMVKFMAEHTDARIGLHLDHSYDEAEVRWAIECGFTSVMFDASRDDLETNIRRTRAMVEYSSSVNLRFTGWSRWYGSLKMYATCCISTFVEVMTTFMMNVRPSISTMLRTADVRICP